MAKKTSNNYQVRATKSAAGQVTIKKGRVYSVPDELSEEIAADLLNAGYLVKQRKPRTTVENKTAGDRETR